MKKCIYTYIYIFLLLEDRLSGRMWFGKMSSLARHCEEEYKQFGTVLRCWMTRTNRNDRCGHVQKHMSVDSYLPSLFRHKTAVRLHYQEVESSGRLLDFIDMEEDDDLMMSDDDELEESEEESEENIEQDAED